MMPSDGLDRSPRRYLIATAVAHYHRSPQYDRPTLTKARNQIIDLFTGQLGYSHVSDLGLDPDRYTLLEQIDRFANEDDRRPDDIVVVYLTGHGEILGSSERRHMFFPADADVGRPKQALPTSQIASVLLDETKLNQVLLLLDTCHSGQGGRDAIAAGLDSLQRDIGKPGSGIAVIASAQPAQLAGAEAFPELLAVAVDSLAAASGNTPSLDLGSIVRHMNANPDRPDLQLIEWNAAKLDGELPAFFPNPRYRAEQNVIAPAIQTATTWDEQDLQRTHELETRMIPAAMASPRGKHEWWFAGRHTALAEIREWLSNPDAKSPLLVVTASPGSGKTAILGLVSMLTDPERHDTVPTHTLGLPASSIPAVGSVDATIYAQALTTAQVVRGLAAAARIRANTVDDLLNALKSRSPPFTAIIDAIDEAEAPDGLLSRLIVPLVEHNEGRLRLLLGTRPHLLRHLHQGLRIDLDDPQYADLDALTEYSHRILVDSDLASPYRIAPHSLTSEVAQAVAEAAAPSFLVARITAMTLASAGAIPDRRDHAWRDSLPRTASTAMAHDLDRLGNDSNRARDLLRPLAYAEGPGLPWEDVWAPLASRISGRPYTDDDLLWLRRTTGSYVIEVSEDGDTLYQLCHRALAEHLRDNVDEITVHQAYVEVLSRIVPRHTDGRQDWTRAHPYTLRHLAVHAAKAGWIDQFVTNADSLVYFDPESLVHSLRQVSTARGRRLRAIYRATVDRHRSADHATRRQLLAIDAVRYGDAELADSLTRSMAWRPHWATGSQTTTALHATLSGHEDSVQAIACCEVKGKKVVVTASTDRTVCVWDLSTGQQRARLSGHTASVNAVACTVVAGVPLAVTAGDDPAIRVWNLDTGQLQNTFIDHTAGVRVVTCTSIHGVPAVLTAGQDGTVRVCDLTSGRERTVLTGHVASVNALLAATLDDVPVAITGSDDRTVRVWDLATGRERVRLTGHDAAINTLIAATLDDVPVAITGSDDRTVRVWDLRTGQQRTSITGHAGWINAVACYQYAGSMMIVIASDNPTVQVWNLATNERHVSLAGHTDWVNAVACLVVDGQPTAVTASHDGTVRVWNLVTGQQTARFTGHTEWITTLTCDEVDHAPVVITASHDHTVRVWNLATGRDQASLVGHSGSVNALAAMVVDGTSVAVTGSDDHTIRVWDLRTGREKLRLIGHTGWVNAVCCHMLHGVPVAMTGSDDRTVRIWNLETGEEHLRLAGHTGWIKAVAYHHLNGMPVAVTGSDDRTVRVWNLDNGEQFATLTGHTDWVGAIACTMVNGVPIVVTGSHDGAVRFWDLRKERVVRVLTGHGGPVNAVACLNLDSAHLALTASNDGTVRVWNLDQTARIATLTGHAAWVNSVACTVIDLMPVAITGADDRTLRIWDLTQMRQIDSWMMPYEVQAVALGAQGEIIAGTGHEVVGFQYRKWDVGNETTHGRSE